MARHTGFLIASLAAATASTAVAQSAGTGPANAAAAARLPIEISSNDVFFTSRWFKASQSKTFSAMCGYAIHGNYLSHDLPRPEWDINVDELKAGDTPVVAISAGAFERVSQDSKAPRNPRAPITALAFTMEGEAEPLTARIVGQPSGDNAIKALLEAAPAQALFAAFYEGRLVTISLGLQDGTTDVLAVHNWKERGYLANANGYLHQCLERLHALPAGAGSYYKINSPLELMSQDPFGAR